MKLKDSIFVSLLSLLFILTSCDKPKEYTYRTGFPDAQMAAYDTDEYVWKKMIEAFEIKTQEPVNLDWELWSTTRYAYSNPCSAVSWPTGNIETSLLSPKAVSIIDNLNNSFNQNADNGRFQNFETTQFAALTLNLTNPYYEELRINKAMFDYIQKKELYNQNEVYKLAKNHQINFPPDAMMIKAQWIPVDSSKVGTYYTKIIGGYDAVNKTVTKDTLMGLVGFHLVTHELPNWVWSTFEHKDNPGLCDYIGCKDDFGNTQAFIPPNKEGIVNQGYTQGQTSSQLAILFEEFNIPEVFKNYRLKGSQTEYTTIEGDPIILGNSILEANLVSSSSCISCHARATLNNTPSYSIVSGDATRSNLSMFIKNDQGGVTPNFEINSDTTTLGFHPVAYTGTPIPEDYLNHSKNKDTIFYPTNFMWQLAQHSKPCTEDK